MQESPSSASTSPLISGHHTWHRAICINGRPIAANFVTKKSGDNACRGKLGYMLESGYWGKGIVTTAVKMVTAVIFEERQRD
ncbi:hypothetical protein LINPERPRIM_LOCUS42763 [Linum perenne]